MLMARWSAALRSKIAVLRTSCGIQFRTVTPDVRRGLNDMMWIIGILTFILILDCLFLMLLVLVQLPKKEAGLGQAFGGGATDALFGAGSGNALTKLTKYATGIFFVMTLSLSILHAHQSRGGRAAERLERQRQAAGAEAPVAGLPSAPSTTGQPSSAPAPTSPPSATPGGLLSAQTNAPTSATPSTNAPVEK